MTCREISNAVHLLAYVIPLVKNLACEGLIILVWGRRTTMLYGYFVLLFCALTFPLLYTVLLIRNPGLSLRMRCPEALK